MKISNDTPDLVRRNYVQCAHTIVKYNSYGHTEQEHKWCMPSSTEMLKAGFLVENKSNKKIDVRSRATIFVQLQERHLSAETRLTGCIRTKVLYTDYLIQDALNRTVNSRSTFVTDQTMTTAF